MIIICTVNQDVLVLKNISSVAYNNENYDQNFSTLNNTHVNFVGVL